MADKIEIKQAQDGQWYWVRVAANGEPVATSETYTREEDALRAAQRERDGIEAEISGS